MIFLFWIISALSVLPDIGRNSLTISKNSKECAISSVGKDGFGHQVEGKLSCLIASELNHKLLYVHIPFEELEHTPDLGKIAETFMNLGFQRVLEKDLNLTRNVMTTPSWTRLAAYEEFPCRNDTLYLVDNCWDLTYQLPMVLELESIKPIIQANYFSSPKPDTGFDTKQFNVAIHIRRGDAHGRLLSVGYYIEAIKYYLQNSSQPIIWIMSDSLHWKGITELKNAFPTLTFHIPQNKHKLFLEFHRMVMAQGLVLSESSLSTAAALLSNCTNIVTYDRSIDWDDVRGRLFDNSPRFHKVPRGIEDQNSNDEE